MNKPQELVTPLIGSAGKRFIENIVEQLIDTSRRNPSLNFRSPKGAITFSYPAASLETLLPNQRKVEIADLIGAPPTPEQVKALRRLSERSRLLSEERGVHALRVAAGLLHWEDRAAGKSYNAPILLLQVDITKSGDSYSLNRTEGAEVELNREFVELLRRHPGCRFNENNLADVLTFDEAASALRAALPTDATVEISKDCNLGIFSYEKLVMVHDIEANADAILAHPLISALNGDPEPLALSQHGIELATPPELDKATADENRVFINEADSSQQEALEAVARGLSLVVQGPPGTGKSQTIVNLIGQALYDGKSVLFVAEKKVALDVVYQRLAQQGLGDAVLAVQRDEDKKRFATSLGLRHAELTAIGIPSGSFRNTSSSIEELNAYRLELHSRIEQTQQTPYELYGRQSRFINETLPIRIANVETLNPDSRDALGELVERLATYPSWLRKPEEATWSSLRPEVSDLALIHDARNDMVAAVEISREIAAHLSKASSIIGACTQSDHEELSSICHWLALLGDSPTIPSNWATSSPDAAVAALERYRIARAKYDGERKSIVARYKESVFESDLDNLADRFLSDYQKFWTRWFSKSYSNDAKTILEQRLADHRQAIYKELRDELATLKDVKITQASWASSNHEMKTCFGDLFMGATSDLDELSRCLAWYKKFAAKRGDATIDGVLFDSLTSNSRDVRNEASSLALRLSSVAEKMQAVLSRLDAIFENIPSQYSDCASFFSSKIEQIEEAPRYCQFRKWISEARSAGCADLLDRLRDHDEFEPDQWRKIFDRIFDASLIDYVHRTRPALAAFDRATHERLRDRFASQDAENVNGGGKRVAARIVQNARSKMDNDEYKGSIAIIAKEASKTRKVMPIRGLARSAFPAISVLKPCWMMSPLAVSQYLPPGEIFDVVVFDEASQMRPADAIAAISRARQVIVVGDNKQLPPTSFFDNAAFGAEEEQSGDEADISDYESILDRCSGVLQQRMLRWHYRSRDESLISFSNKEFYDSRLVTFPTPAKRRGLGVRFVKVAGSYSRGGSRQNQTEAREVARISLDHAKMRPSETLGIIAFSQAQQRAIEDAIEKALEEDGTDAEFFAESRPASERVFVKNLESVQGDERDVILLSIGYGKDDEGRLSYNFGPLNRAGGGRRLNVAVTRAKNEMVVISSIDDHDLDASKCQQGGPLLVRSYLAYARAGGSARGSTEYTGRGVDSPFEEDVRLVLADAGHKVHLQVGASGYRIDLAVCHPERPGQYILAVECDGATYHSSPTARDRDRLRDRTLKSFGWKIHRIWSRDWFRRRADEIERLKAAIDIAYRSSDVEEELLPEIEAPSPLSNLDRDDKAHTVDVACVSVYGFLDIEKRGCTKKEVVDATSLPEVFATAALDRLIEQGLVTKSGIGRGTKYLASKH